MNSRRIKLIRKKAKQIAARRNAKLKADQQPVWAEHIEQKLKKQHLKKIRSTNEPKPLKLTRRQKERWERERELRRIEEELKKQKPNGMGLAGLPKPRRVTL